MAAMGLTESGQCQHHRGAHAIAPVVAGLRPIVAIEERSQQVHLVDQRPRRAAR